MGLAHYKDKKEFPQLRVKNKRLKSHNGRADMRSHALVAWMHLCVPRNILPNVRALHRWIRRASGCREYW